METAILNYRYRLWPTPQQERALSESMAIARRSWNAMVSLRQHVLDQCRRGREANIRRELVAIEAAKRPVGMRAAKMRRLAEEFGAARVEASMQEEITAKVGKMSWWVLAQTFAVARAAQAKTAKCGSAMGSMWWQVADAFGLACKALQPGRRLRFRRRDESAPLRVQHQAELPVRERKDGVAFADLGSLIAADKREALRWVRYEAHRKLPAGAKVKRIALTYDRLGWHVVFSVEAPQPAVAKNFPRTDRTAGVDPGRSIAFTIAPSDSPDHGQSDGYELSGTRGQKRLLRRVARLARKADRQRRAANPECYREDGTIIRGQRPRRTSKGLETYARLDRQPPCSVPRSTDGILPFGRRRTAAPFRPRPGRQLDRPGARRGGGSKAERKTHRAADGRASARRASRGRGECERVSVVSGARTPATRSVSSGASSARRRRSPSIPRRSSKCESMAARGPAQHARPTRARAASSE